MSNHFCHNTCNSCNNTNISEYERIGNTNVYISTMCMQSYPCQHSIIIDGVESTMNGVDIFNYLKNNNLPMSQHFNEYKNFIYG
jgi:hypothetical protein